MKKEYDCVIVGAGPAGISAAIYLARAQLSCLVIGKWKLGNLYKAHVVANYFGFSKNIVKQVQNGNLMSVDDLQKSLDAFAFDILENKLLETKKINRPVAYFMSILRKGNSYLPPNNFMSDEDKAIDDLIQKKERELQIIKEREKRLFRAEFELWFNELTEEQCKDRKFYLPGTKYLGDIHMANLKSYFETHFWPTIWSNIQKNFKNQKESNTLDQINNLPQ